MTYKEWIGATARKNFVDVSVKNCKGIIYESTPPVLRDGKHYFHVIFSNDSGVEDGQRHQMISEDEIQLL